MRIDRFARSVADGAAVVRGRLACSRPGPTPLHVGRGPVRPAPSCRPAPPGSGRDVPDAEDGGAPPSNDSAARLPVPVTITVSALPGAQPGRSTTSWTTAARFGVSCFGPAAPRVCHGGTDHATEASFEDVRRC
jgi:hypothetical protein